MPAVGGSHCSPHAALTMPSPQRHPASTVHVAEQPSQLVVLPSSHSSPASTTPLPHPGGVQLVSQCPGVPLSAPSSHCSAPHTMPSPQPLTSLQSLLHVSQLSVLPSSHSSPASTMPLPHTAVFGGSSILMNFPRPFPSFTSGSSDLHVQTLPSGSKTISRMKLPRVGTGYALKRSSFGSKRMSVSDAEPVIHTSPVCRFALRA